MYYPYLRGKQFELLALRDFAEYYMENENILPIIEPVKNTFNSMKLAIKKLQENKIPFAIVLNPQVGDVINNVDLIESELGSGLTAGWTPAFIVNNNYAQIEEHVASREYNNVMLIRKKDADGNDDKFEALASKEFVEKIVLDPAFKGVKRRLSKMGKKVIRLDDNFLPQLRNSDYVGLGEELFSEEYRYYEDEGFSGISDYTVLPSTFIEGGRLPYAIAIHLTYEKKEDQIYVRHFVSDTNDDSSNIQGKFGEAASKAIAFFKKIDKSNYAIQALNNYYKAGQYPGLGMIKKISILNHLELMNDVLNRI